jgi:hypothetical protein
VSLKLRRHARETPEEDHRLLEAVNKLGSSVGYARRCSLATSVLTLFDQEFPWILLFDESNRTKAAKKTIDQMS